MCLTDETQPTWQSLRKNQYFTDSKYGLQWIDSQNDMSREYYPPNYYIPILLDNNAQPTPFTDYIMPTSVSYNGSMVILPDFYHFNVTDDIQRLTIDQQV